MGRVFALFWPLAAPLWANRLCFCSMNRAWVWHRSWWTRSLVAIPALKSEGTTILLVEQNAFAAVPIADRGYVLETGSVVLQGSGRELLANENVRADAGCPSRCGSAKNRAHDHADRLAQAQCAPR